MVKRQNTRSARQNMRSERKNTRSARQNTRSARQNMRSERKNTRSARQNMRSERKNTRSARQNMRSTRQNGGYKIVLSPAELVDTSMKGATTSSMNQGADFFGYHKAQHGGQAPVGYTGMLDDALRGSARIGSLDVSVGEIRGMKDQAGGRRRKGRKTMRKGGRKMRGGMRALGSMDVGAPGMLLDGAQARQALSTMNAEWKLAESPSSFAPKL